MAISSSHRNTDGSAHSKLVRLEFDKFGNAHGGKSVITFSIASRSGPLPIQKSLLTGAVLRINGDGMRKRLQFSTKIRILIDFRLLLSLVHEFLLRAALKNYL